MAMVSSNMTCYLPLIGRFGNLLFQWAYLRAYCEQHGYEMCLEPNVVEQVFDVPAAVRPRKGIPADVVLAEDTRQRQECLIYTRKQVKDWLRIKPSVLEMLKPILENRRPVLLDVRRGNDYIGAGLVSLGPDCYIDAAQKCGYDPGTQCEWEIDTGPTRLTAFTGNVTAAGLGTTWVSLPAFYRMMTAQVHFRANSTFSWWAATLGNAKVYAPVIRGMQGGVPDQYCDNWVEGNWPAPSANAPNTDLHLKEE